jgi:hypothetical protein
MQVTRDIMSDQGTSSKEKKEFRRLLLPDKNTPGGRKAWNSGGPNSNEIPAMLRPLSPPV